MSIDTNLNRLYIPWLKAGCALSLSLLALLNYPSQVLAQSASIDDLARKILQRELDLQELNANLHMEAANPSFSRARRTWLWDLGNALPTEGGLIAATALFYSHSTDKIENTYHVNSVNGISEIGIERKRVHNHIPDCQVAATIIPQIAGQVVGGTGSLFELGADCRRSLQLHRRRLDRHTANKRAIALKNEIDEMLRRYDDTAAASQAEVNLAEAKVLKDIRNNCVSEFARLEKSAALLSTGQVIEDAVSFSRNTIGGVGNSINVAAIMRNNKRLNGEADILNLVAASMITARPFVSNTGSWLARRASDRRMRQAFGDLDKLKQNSLVGDLEILKCTAAAVANRGAMAQRLAIYAAQIEADNSQSALAEDESKKAKQVIVRRFRESVYGPTKLAQATIGVIIGFRAQNNATADNRLAAAGNLTYTSGQVFNIAELVRERLVDEAKHSLEVQTGMLPGQRIDRQMQAVENLRSLLAQ